MSESPSVSLLMPVHNRAHLLERVLGNLAENTTYPDVELIAVDDGSTDARRDVLREWAADGRIPNMRVIETDAPGAIASLNTALNAAGGDLCVQLDDDVTVETHGWVERMVDLMQFDDSIGVVTAKVVFDSGAIHCCGVNVVDPWGWHERPMRPREPLGRRQWLNRLEKRPDEGDAPEVEDRVAEVDSGIGCCMMYRRADALEAGGYDREWAPVWFDDVDLCLKIRALGRKVFYTPEVRAIHHFGARARPAAKRPRQSPRRLVAENGRRVARRLPHALARRVEARLAIDLYGDFTHQQCLMLRHHHAYWRSKWGWDARNPDMDEIRRRWGDTEIWWRYDDERRAAGERIATAYQEGRAAGGVAPAERGS